MTLCFIRKEGKTLMLHVRKENCVHDGFWNGLGGKFESGETPEECVQREVEEESGLRIKDPVLKGSITFQDVHDKTKNNGHVYIFVAEEYDGNLIDSPEGKLEWIPDDQFHTLKRHAGDKFFMPWLDQDKFFSAKFRYDGEELVDHVVNFY